MPDPRIEKLAGMLVDYSVCVKPGDKVAIISPEAAAPLTKAIFLKVLQAGGHPMVMSRSMEIMELLYRYGSTKQLEFVHEGQQIVVEKYDVNISIIGEENTKTLPLTQTKFGEK